MRDNLKHNLKTCTAADELLAWYDDFARDLPWRISPEARKSGIRPDPYRVWLSEIMLQQTTVVTVRAYFERFTSLWQKVEDLAAADNDRVMAEWAGLGYYARARNLYKCAQVITSDYNGAFPPSKDELLKLPGVGPYTASAVASIAFDLPETVVDGNVERVISRLIRVETPLPKAKLEITEFAQTLTPKLRPGDYAQAIMDLGATICTPKSPKCDMCPWHGRCAAYAADVAVQYPRKTPKKPKPTRRGFVVISQSNTGDWVLEKRPESGLLGGMMGWPGSQWHEDHPEIIQKTGQIDAGQVRHTFTHFHLELDILVQLLEPNPAQDAVFQSSASFDPSHLPTVMRKAFSLAQTHFEE